MTQMKSLIIIFFINLFSFQKNIQIDTSDNKTNISQIDSVEYLFDVHNSIKITSCYFSRPDYCGGRDIYFRYQNLSKKTIKYLIFEVEFYNAVDDLVSCFIRNKTLFRCKDTGPIYPLKYNDKKTYWPLLIYNWQVTKMRLKTIEIEYMDGTTLEIEQDALRFILGYKSEYGEH